MVCPAFIVPSVKLAVVPVAKLIRVAVGRLDNAGARGCGAEVDVASGEAKVGRGVKVTGVRVDVDISACSVSAALVEIESNEGIEVTAVPQAVTRKRNTVPIIPNAKWCFMKFILSPGRCTYKLDIDCRTRL